MRPYYEENGITIFHGDCREILPLIEAGYVLVTDPPYGLSLGKQKDWRGGSHGLAKRGYASYDDSPENYHSIVIPALEIALQSSIRGAIFCPGSHVRHLPAADALGGVYCPAATGCHKWGFNTILPVLLYGTAPGLNYGRKHTAIMSTDVAESNGHPCPKPIPWMKWLVKIATEDRDTVLDPFMGSGTTLRAAKDLGRKAIGIEICEEYCEIAAERLRQNVFDFTEASA